MSDSSTAAKVTGWATRRVQELQEEFPFITRMTRQMVAVNLLDSATRLAAQTFLTALPVLFVVAAFTPASVRQHLLDSLRGMLGLDGASADQVRQVFGAQDDATRNATGVIGVLVLLASATACSRALQRVCERAWHLPPGKFSIVAWRWLAWLAVWFVALVMQGLLRDGFGAGLWLGLPLCLVTSTALWWWTQHLLLGGRMTWLPLLPGALLTGIGAVGLTVASRIYIPRTLDRSLAQFGPFGLVFTLLSWLIVLFTVVCVGISAGYVIAHERLPARLLRVPQDPPADPAAQARPGTR
ncbi:YhjD/YihY/BrkB family envelope integrity protein [Streptomyces sp. VRA16 Mangrove soil]|uniref:YhjD/YihY/BrkB family envelope integrity protein n=1 Tax=Streptomyces sp. VRA16 Mangrove soil TaxID=2817434 RepID=UPI001A9E217B|nr:YhjD/YihY/BrkB family envelope integrity protein [Streptomyces sp. VRA16 Mangrove soil]MBO1333547.1 YihY/virulence factor BrkB family protein [Streptomyces sp. VRA16 Mangrove soil]